MDERIHQRAGGGLRVSTRQAAPTRREVLVGAGRAAALVTLGGGLAGVLAAGGTSSPPDRLLAAVGAGKGKVSGQIDFSWWGTGERNTKTQAVMSLFQKKYPKASIQGEPVGDFTTYWQKLTVEAAAHNLPDVPQMQVRYMQAYDTRHALRPLDDLVKDGAIDVSGIPKVLVNSGRGPDGKLYMVPTGSATNNWMFNDTMVKAAGLPSPTTLTSWNAIQSYLLEAKDKLPKGVYAIDLRGDDDSIWWAWMSTHGHKVFTKSGTLGFPKSVMVDYWNWWLKLLKGGATVPAAMRQEEPTSNVQTYLAVGKAMMDEAPANQLAAYQAVISAAGKGSMSVAMFPKTAKGNGMTLINSGMSIAQNTTNLNTAAAWVNFFANDPAGAAAYASDNGAVTVTKLLNTQIAGADSLAPGTKQYLQFIKAVIAGKPQIIDFPANYQAVTLSLTNNWSNVAFGKASVESAVDSFFNDANSAAAGG